MQSQRQTPSHAPLRMSWNIDTDTAKLRPVREAFEGFIRDAGACEKITGELGLVLNEALANVIRHGYGGAAQRPIAVEAAIDNGRLKLTIRDWGKPFDPAKLAIKPRDPLVPGGLGLICMRQIMDYLKFEPLSDGMLLTMEKNLLPASEAGEAACAVKP